MMKQAALIAALSFTAGALIAVGFAFYARGGPSEWIGFAGGIIGSVVTLAAAALAFGLTRRQVDMQAEELRYLREESARQSDVISHMVMKHAIDVGVSTIKSIRDARKHSNNGKIPASILRKFPEIKDKIGFEQLWKIDKNVSNATIYLDLAISNYNKSIELRTESRSVFEISQLEDIMKNIANKSHTIIETMSPKLAELTRNQWNTAMNELTTPRN